MKEEYLHFLWKYKRFASNKFTSTTNQSIEIIDFGFHNLHSGPDFLNGKIQINNVIFVGSIEFHIKSSDWYAHKHHFDDAYNNVILHVVLEHDRDVLIYEQKIETVELKDLIDEQHYKHFQSHLMNPDISCSKRLSELNELDWINQIDGLSISRIERKLKENQRLLEELDFEFSKLLYVMIGKALGGKVNAEGFELLCNRMNSNHFSKLGKENYKFEAYVLGLAGMLEKEFSDEYPNFLKSEWAYLKVLLDLDGMDLSSWKYGRLRPKGFPLVRLVQFIGLLMKKDELIEKMEQELSLKAWFETLDLSFNSYWEQHEKFDKKGKGIVFSNGMKERLLVNAILPFRSLLLSRKGIDYLDYYEKILSELPPEKNHIVTKWSEHRVKPLTMFDSQGLIELYNEFCLKKQCLNCKFGVKFMN
jgi:hypothetical protein